MSNGISFSIGKTREAMLLFKHIIKEDYICALILNGPLFYFSACALLGISADPEEGFGITYKIYMVSLLLMGVFLWVKEYLKSKTRVLPLFILFIYIIVGYIQGYKEHRLFLQMVCFSIPATCIALKMNDRSELAKIMKLMDLLLPVFAISFIFMIKELYYSSLEGYGSYNQNASYMVAFCFLIDIFLLLNNDSYPKFKFLDSKWYNVFKIALLPYFVVLAFFGGGRGAFITILVGLFFAFVLRKKRIPIKKIMKILVWLSLIIFLVIIVLSRLNKDYLDLLYNNYDRITALVSDGSIDTSASSGRDEIWKHALVLINDKPILGYGLFSYLEKSNWPHNVFLEVLLQGGLVLFLTFIMVMVLSFSKYHRMIRYDSSQIWLAPLMIFAFTELLFSGSYMFQTYFWFSLSYIYGYKFKKSVNVVEKLKNR